MPLLRYGVPWLALVAWLGGLASCGSPPPPGSAFWEPIARPDGGPGTGGKTTTGGSGGAPGVVGGSSGAGGSGGGGGQGLPDANGPGDARLPDAGEASTRTDAPSPDGPFMPSASCGLTVDVTTATAGGEYASENIGAIWIANSSDKWIKTLSVWANRRIEHLTHWNEVTQAAGKARNKVDAVSAATSDDHTARNVKWNCTDVDKMQVLDGQYRVCFEMTESNSADGDEPSEFECVNFIKGSQPVDVMPPDHSSFQKRRLRFTP